MKLKRYFGLFFLVVHCIAWSQKNYVKVSVLDFSEKTPLLGAHVCLESANGIKHYYSTDIDGNTVVPFLEETSITISYTGYKTTMLALANEANFEVLLKPDLLSLDQVVVTASLKPIKVDQSIYKVKVLNSSTMEKQGVQNVRDALRFQTGVNLIEDGVLGSQIIMQGLEGQYVKFLIDGVPIIGRQDGNIDLSQIDISQVDHIEIVEGPMSVVYGSNALAGTINIITKQNKYYNFSSNANVYVESVGQLNGNVGLLGNIRNSKYGMFIGYRWFDGYDMDTTTRSMNWNPKNQNNVDAFYGFKSKGWDTKFGVRLSMEDLIYKGDYLIPNRAIDIQFLTNRFSYYGSFSKQINAYKTLTGLISYNTYKRKVQEHIAKDDINVLEKRGDAYQDVFKTLNARVSYAQDFKAWLVWQMGYELTQEMGEGAKVVNNDGITENAIWSDLKINLSEKLIFQPGIRYLHHSMYQAPIIFSSHIKWNPSKKWEGRVSVAKGFRTPSMKELYMNFVDSNHKIFGNENLKPETSYNVTAALGKSFFLTENSIVKFEATTFSNHLYDVIELASDGKGIAFVYKNISEKKTHGGTFGINYQYQFFKLNLGMAITGIGYDLNNNGNFDYQYSTDVTIMSKVNLRKSNISTQLDYKYTGARSQLFAGDTKDEIGVGIVSGYHMLNFSTTKNFIKSGFFS
jgi:outer membrane receptor for ferrienterochelin and colicins